MAKTVVLLNASKNVVSNRKVQSECDKKPTGGKRG